MYYWVHNTLADARVLFPSNTLKSINYPIGNQRQLKKSANHKQKKDTRHLETGAPKLTEPTEQFPLKQKEHNKFVMRNSTAFRQAQHGLHICNQLQTLIYFRIL